jgi:hypothetical protein
MKMTRVEKVATALPNGREILELLNASRAEMIAVVKQGRPPVTAVSQRLIDAFGDQVKNTPVKQFVGLAIRTILEEAGFEIAYSGAKIPNDRLFSAGSVYRAHAGHHDATPADDALERMLCALTPSQARRALNTLTQAFPYLRSESKTKTPPRK